MYDDCYWKCVVAGLEFHVHYCARGSRKPFIVSCGKVDMGRFLTMSQVRREIKAHLDLSEGDVPKHLEFTRTDLYYRNLPD